MAQATVNATTNETARELKLQLENGICTLRHAARAVSDYAKEGNYTPLSIEWLLTNLAVDAKRLHDTYREWFVADRRARGIPDPMLPAEAVLS
jgi:hypothetical protein